METIELHGCTPEPLMSYLKALGILRLVSEQVDPNARGAWRDGVFALVSELNETALRTFLLSRYQPTPVFSPWNGGCGFYLKCDPKTGMFKKREAADALNTLAESTSSRLKPYREELKRTKSALEKLGTLIDLPTRLSEIREEAVKQKWSERKTKEERDKFLNSVLLFEVNDRTVNLSKADKDEFLTKLRSEVLSDLGLLWLDATLVLLTGQKKNRTEAPVLGSGGNVGNMDFSALFAQTLPEVIPLNDEDAPTERATCLLQTALFGDGAPGLPVFSIGQFDPGKAGGANQGQGMEGSPLVNPWDYLLMIEGALTLGGSVTRRLNASQSGASFPFAVDSSQVGYPSTGEDSTRGELWLPLWRQPLSLAEARVLFGEGRCEVGGKLARTGVGFARAVASLGIDRGISDFVRYEFQERLGQSYIATPLGRFHVHERKDVYLLEETDHWLARFRQACGEDTAPARFKSALRRIDAAIFDFCHYGGTARFADILRALGSAERRLAGGEKFRSNDRRTIPPLGGLSAGWAAAANDGSFEFELALALSGVRGSSDDVPPLRGNVEPVTESNGRFAWAERGRGVVWGQAALPVNLAAVLSRRVMDAGRQAIQGLPLDSVHRASMVAVASFIAHSVDDERLEELLWGLLAVNSDRYETPVSAHRGTITPLPRAYALLKLLFLPFPLATADGVEVRLRPEAEILALLRGGRVGHACQLAMRRLRAEGLEPLPHRNSGGGNRDREWSDAGAVDAGRLAGALLFPITPRSAEDLLHSVTRDPKDDAEEQIEAELNPSGRSACT